MVPVNPHLCFECPLSWPHNNTMCIDIKLVAVATVQFWQKYIHIITIGLVQITLKSLKSHKMISPINI